MACAARNDEQVPDSMRMGETLVDHIEHDAHCIEQPARHQPGETVRSQRMPQLGQRRQSHPAHHDVDHQGQYARFAALHQFLQDAECGQPPHHAEQRPAPGAAQRYQTERGVTSGDQQIDAVVVQLAQDDLGPPAQAVIQR